MKLVLTLLIRNEEDILRENILYHLEQGVDFIIAMDNRSTDASRDILNSFEQQGVLKVLTQDEDTYDQSRWVTQMARLATTEYAADWVINSDADEFWWPAACVDPIRSLQKPRLSPRWLKELVMGYRLPNNQLKRVLSNVPPNYSALRCRRVNFLPVSMEQQCFYKNMIYRELYSKNTSGNPLPPKCCHRASESVTVAFGNHSVSGLDGDTYRSYPDILIYHFPLRSYQQFENKIRLGTEALQNNDALDDSVVNTWRTLYTTYQQGNLRDVYTSHMLTEEQCTEQCASGELFRDQQLARFLQKYCIPA